MPTHKLAGRIERLKAEKGALILAHNYQPPEIQDIADHLGDSLDLSRLAQELPSKFIIFCGVHFMAETAAILSPDKKIILPEPAAGCPMADMITPEDLLSLKEQSPEAVVVMYVNSTAAVKSHTDICCTSANALKVVESIPEDRKIIFGPDQHLGRWIISRTQREMLIWGGYCPPHQMILPKHIRKLKEAHPGALVMVHPEVESAVAAGADAVLGTGGMLSYAGERDADTFIVGTEVGMCYRLEKAYPDKRFIPASPRATCKNMKKISLEKVLSSLENLEPVVSVPPDIAKRAKSAIEKMVEIG